MKTCFVLASWLTDPERAGSRPRQSALTSGVGGASWRGLTSAVTKGVRHTRVASALALGALMALAAETPPTAGTAASAASASGTSGPKIQFAELTYDFGKLDVGAVVKHDFVFTNIGDAVLEITEVKPGCGCTTAGTWDKRVEPGKTGAIPLQFNSAGFSGPVSKSATITCNDVARSNVFLQIRGTVWRPIDITPASAYFNVLSETPTNQTRVVRIVNNLAEPLSLEEPVCTNRAFQVELQTVKPGKEFELRITVQPPFAATYIQAPITLKTSATNTPVLTIPAFANVQPAVTVIPSQITLPAGTLTTALRPAVTIRNTGTNALALSDAAINLEGASVQIREVQPGRVFSLTVSLPAGLQLQATQKVEVAFKSNHPKFPLLKVPVVQPQRTAATAVTRPVAPQPPPMLARPVTGPTAK